MRDGDPFHSSECCRAHHGVAFLGDEASERYQRGRKKQKPTPQAKELMGRGIKSHNTKKRERRED